MDETTVLDEMPAEEALEEEKPTKKADIPSLKRRKTEIKAKKDSS